MSDVMKSDQVEKHIRAWLQRFIVDLNLCPFARPLIADPALRISVCNADNLADLHHAFLSELDMIQQSSDQLVATSLMVMPCVLDNFDEYLDFLGHAEILLKKQGWMALSSLPAFTLSISLPMKTPIARATTAIARPIRRFTFCARRWFLRR